MGTQDKKESKYKKKIKRKDEKDVNSISSLSSVGPRKNRIDSLSSVGSGSGSDSDESVSSVSSNESVGKQLFNSPINKQRTNPTKAHSSTSQTQKKLTYNSLNNFLADFPEPPKGSNDGSASSRATIVTPEDNKTLPTIIGPEAPLLPKPQTVREILGLTPAQIGTALEMAKNDAIKAKSNKAFWFLCSITLGAVIIEPLYSYFMRESIQSDTTFWFSKGHTTDPTAGLADSSFMSSWALAVFNLMVDMLSVNPIEEAYEMCGVFNQEGLQKKLEEIKKNPGRWAFHTLAKLGLFIPVSAILSSSDVTGLRDLTHDDNIGFKISTGVAIELLGIIYYIMFSAGQFEKHLDALADFAFKLGNSIYEKFSASSVPSPSEKKNILKTEAQALPEEESIPKKDEVDEFGYELIDDEFEAPLEKGLKDTTIVVSSEAENNRRWTQLLEDVSVAFEKNRIVVANWGFRGISTLVIFMKVMTGTLGLQSSPTLEKLYILVGVAGLTQAVLTRTLQTYNSFKFEKLSPKEIKEAKVGTMQKLMDGGTAVINGGSLATLIYSYAPISKVYAAPLGAALGMAFSAMTWVGSQYRSKGETALEKKEKQTSQSSPTTNHLHQVLLMTESELFDQVVIKSKSSESHKQLVRGATVVNDIARAARVVMFGDFVNTTGDLLSDWGLSFGGEVDDQWKFIRQLCITMFFGIPVQMNDAKVFGLGLIGKSDDAEGTLSYLNAKRLISGWFGMFSHLLTPKKHYDYPTLFKTLCVLDRDLSDTFMATAENFKGEGISDDDIIKMLRDGVKKEYLDTINRLKRWLSDAEFMKDPELKKWLSSYKEIREALSSKPATEFAAADYPKIKEMEYGLFRFKMQHWDFGIYGYGEPLSTPKDDSSETSNKSDKDEKYPTPESTVTGSSSTAISHSTSNDSTVVSDTNSIASPISTNSAGGSGDFSDEKKENPKSGYKDILNEVTQEVTASEGDYRISKEALEALDEEDRVKAKQPIKLTITTTTEPLSALSNEPLSPRTKIDEESKSIHAKSPIKSSSPPQTPPTSIMNSGSSFFVNNKTDTPGETPDVEENVEEQENEIEDKKKSSCIIL